MTSSAEASQSITRLIRAVQDGSSSAVRPLLVGVLRQAGATGPQAAPEPAGSGRL